jgi:hypothetical protein
MLETELVLNFILNPKRTMTVELPPAGLPASSASVIFLEYS